MATKANKTVAGEAAETFSTVTLTPAPDLQTTLEESVNLPCARKYFYQMALTAWAYCLANRTLFLEESDRYTEEFIEEQVAYINTVKNLPDLSVLLAAATEANQGLVAWRQQVGSLSKRLSNAIGYTFKNPATADSERQLAGLTDFNSPSAEPWAQVDSFLTKANNYLTAKISVLVTAKGTTASLQTKFTAVTSDFSAAWTNFILKEKTVVDGTKVTIAGLKAILKELNPMLDDGKVIFEFDAVNRRKFTVKHLVKEVRGTHPAGLEGYVRNGLGKGIEAVLVQVQDQPDNFAMTDKKGKYKINLAAGTSAFNYTMAGMEPQSVTRNLTAGVTSRQNVVLIPVPALVTLAEEPPAEKTADTPLFIGSELSNALSDVTVNAPSTNGVGV